MKKSNRSNSRFTTEYIEWVLTLMQDSISLNTKVGPGNDDEDDTELGDLLADTESPTPEDELLEKNRHDVLMRYLSEYLTEKEAEVISMRYGLNSDRPLTLAEIGDKFKVSREFIRQIEARALRKLRLAFKRNNITWENI